MKKIALIIILILVVGFGGYFFFASKKSSYNDQNTVSQDSSLQKYTNTKFGYEIMLPTHYAALSEYDGMPYTPDPESEFLILGDSAGITDKSNMVEIETIEKTTDATKQLVYTHRLEGGDQLKEIKIGDLRFNIHQFTDSTWVAYIYETDKVFYIFRFDKDNEIGKRIVESFKLI